MYPNVVPFFNVTLYAFIIKQLPIIIKQLTHSCPPFQHLLSERLTSLGIIGAPRVPPYSIACEPKFLWVNWLQLIMFNLF